MQGNVTSLFQVCFSQYSSIAHRSIEQLPEITHAQTSTSQHVVTGGLRLCLPAITEMLRCESYISVKHRMPFRSVSHTSQHMEAGARYCRYLCLQGTIRAHRVHDRFLPSQAGATDTMMEGSKFAKLCKDCGLVDKKLSATDVDLIFTKVRLSSSRCIIGREGRLD